MPQLNKWEDSWLYVYFNDSKDVLPTQFIETVVIWESINMLFPVMAMRFQDLRSIALDHEGFAKIQILFGTDQSNFSIWNFINTVMKESPITYLKEPTLQSRILECIDETSLKYLATSKIKGYGYTTASNVIRTIVNNIHRDEKQLTLNIEESVDKNYYVQAGFTNSQFIYYLADRAVNSNGYGGYFAWIDYRHQDASNQQFFSRFNFTTVEKLSNQDVKAEIIYNTHHNVLGEAKANRGILKDGSILAWGLSIGYDSFPTVRSYSRKVAWYDIENLRYMETEKDIEDFKRLGNKQREEIKKYDPIFKHYDNYLQNNDLRLTRLDYAATSTSSEVKGIATKSMQRNWFKRHCAIQIFGNLKLRVGDKVKLTVPLAAHKPFMESLSGEWIIAKMIHMIAFPATDYIIKVVLARDEWLGDIV